MKVIENPNPEYGNQPFPESIVIEFTEENKGKLTIKLSAQSKAKVYQFSHTVLENPETIQTYYNGKYSLKEKATTLYSEGSLSVQLIWTEITDSEKAVDYPPSSYLFTLDETGLLLFTRINGKAAVFKAHYSLE